MERKLASIQEVREIVPIEGADKIELAHVLGWQCVVKKGEFRPGDHGVFFEIDAIPPRVPSLEFLWTGRSNPDKVRLTTVRLRGQLSQGLMMPLDLITEIQEFLARNGGRYFTGFAGLNIEGYNGLKALHDGRFAVGFDLTELLDVRKYEPPVTGEARGPLPSYIPKTDEPRVQSVPAVLEAMRGEPYVITEKIDGTSATFLVDPFDDSFHVCGRTQSLLDTPGSVYWKIARKYDIEKWLRAYPGYAVQGEIYGPGIQGNRLEATEPCFMAFNVYDITRARYLSHMDAQSVFRDLGHMISVPVIEKGSSFEYTQEELLAKAEGKYMGTKNEREGIVIRPLYEQKSVALGGDRLSFKVISNRYLLKGGE